MSHTTLTVDTITDEQIAALRERATVRHPVDDGARDAAWVCAKCGESCGYWRKRPMYGYDMADAHCFTANCVGGVFCSRSAYRFRVGDNRNARRSDHDRLDRNATVQLATRALAGEGFARACCTRILNGDAPRSLGAGYENYNDDPGAEHA